MTLRAAPHVIIKMHGLSDVAAVRRQATSTLLDGARVTVLVSEGSARSFLFSVLPLRPGFMVIGADNAHTGRRATVEEAVRTGLHQTSRIFE